MKWYLILMMLCGMMLVAKPHLKRIGVYDQNRPQYASLVMDQLSDHFFAIYSQGVRHYGEERKNDLPVTATFHFFNLETKKVEIKKIPVYTFFNQNRALFLGGDPVEVYRRGNRSFRPQMRPYLYNQQEHSAGFLIRDRKTRKKYTRKYERTARRVLYTHWNLKTNQQRSITLGTYDKRTLFKEIGWDQGKNIFYYYTVFNSEGKPFKKPEKVILYGIDLNNFQINKILEFKPVKRSDDKYFRGAILTENGSHILFTEYEEFKDAEKPRGYFVDLKERRVGNFMIPLTPYGVVIDQKRNQILIASSKEGQLYVYNSKTLKLLKKIKTVKRLHQMALSKSGKYLWILGNSAAGGRGIDLFHYPKLKRQRVKNSWRWFGQRKVYPSSGVFTRDGKHLFMPTLKPDGFPDRKGFQLFEILD